jgi:hypothetical protein
MIIVWLIFQAVNAPTAPGHPLAGRQWSDVWPLHAKGDENGELPLLVVVKHAFPRHGAGGDVNSLSYSFVAPWPPKIPTIFVAEKERQSGF